MSLVTFVENIGTYVSLAKVAYSAYKNDLPGLEAEEKAVWADVQPALEAVKTSLDAIEQANGIIEKVEDVPTFLGKCLTFVGAVGVAETNAAASEAVKDSVTAVKQLADGVKDILGSPAAAAQTPDAPDTDS